MTQRGDIISQIQQATSLAKQGALVAELDRFDRESVARHQAANDLDWAGTVVTETLAPATAHERSTHETDWLGEITASTEDWANKVSAEAALWFGRTSAEVKADPEEFTEQAKGMARRTASAYGEQMANAERAFLDYVSFLHTQAASGLDQVQQTVDSHENPKPTPLPEEVFDTFGPPVHPINSGVSGTESSERAPLLQEIESDGGGGGAPTHHDTAPQPYTYAEVPPAEPQQMTGGLFQPTMAIGHVTNLTEYLASLEVEGASGLDQVQQVVDSQENPKPTPLPEEVAFPWEIEAQPEQEERSDVKTSGLTPAQARAAHVARLSAKPDAELTDTDRREIKAFAASLFKTADEYTQPEQFHGPGAANSPATTTLAPSGTEQSGEDAGQADRSAGDAPSFGDNSSSVPPFAKGYAEGYGSGQTQMPGATPGLLPPGAGGMGQGYTTHAGSLQTEAKIVTCDNCGKEDSHFNMQQRGNGSTVEHLCTDCAPVSKDPSKVRWQGSLTVSASFVSPIETADPEFAKAYKYASRWTEGTRLVKKGSPSFEAGLYAGMTDNTREHQDAWVDVHQRAAARYRDPAFTNRLVLHEAFTKQASRALGSYMQGIYLAPKTAEQIWGAQCSKCGGETYKANGVWGHSGGYSGGKDHEADGEGGIKQSSQKTAGTVTDLDTMGPGVSPSATGETPINGPGKPPPLQGGEDPARSGGPAPYNGAEPYGVPAVPSGTAVHGSPTAIDITPGAPVDQAAYQRLSPQTHAFRKTVQANLLQTKQR